MLNYKSLLLFISLLTINNAFGQENVNTYKTKKGASISIGDELTLGNAFNLLVFETVDKLIDNNNQPLEESFRGSVLTVERIEITNRGNVKVFTSNINKTTTDLVINDLDRAIKIREIIKINSINKYPAEIQGKTVAYYDVKSDSTYNIELNSNTETKNDLNNSAALYLKRAGKLKNASIALAAISATIAIVPSDPDSPNIEKNQKSKTIVSAIGGVASLILNIVGNSSLIKAGEALE